jgi:hypothetical protein
MIEYLAYTKDGKIIKKRTREKEGTMTAEELDIWWEEEKKKIEHWTPEK